MLLSIPRHRVSSVLGFLWPDKPLCPPTQQRLPSPMQWQLELMSCPYSRLPAYFSESSKLIASSNFELEADETTRTTRYKCMHTCNETVETTYRTAVYSIEIVSI